MSNSETASVGQAQPTAVFEPSPNPRPSLGTIALVIVTFIFVFGGFYLMGLAFAFENIGIELFSAGILADAFGLWLAFGIIPSRER